MTVYLTNLDCDHDDNLLDDMCPIPYTFEVYQAETEVSAFSPGTTGNFGKRKKRLEEISPGVGDPSNLPMHRYSPFQTSAKEKARDNK